MKPTLRPSRRASTVATDLPYRSLSSNVESRSAIALMTLRTSYTLLRDSGTMSSIWRHASPELAGTGCTGGASLQWLGKYDRKCLIASSACSSVSTARSTKPDTPVNNFQPPSSSDVIGLLISIEVPPGLAIAMIAPLRITTKSDIAEYHVDEP